MTDDEVQVIYDYLHENYEYRDGGLYRNKKLGKWKQSTELGTFLHRDGARFERRTKLTINKKIYDYTVARFIYIYHHKKDAIYIEFKDKNPMNISIENLIDVKRRSNKPDRSAIGFTTNETKNGPSYRAIIYINGKNVSLGAYKTKEMANNIYNMALDLSVNSDMSTEEIKLKIHEKFPEYKLYLKNKTGFKGVMNYRNNKFIAQIMINRHQKHLGVFNTPEEAHAAYLKAKEEHKNE